LGVIQILLDQSIAVDLRDLIARVAEGQPVAVDKKVTRQLVGFLRGRLDNLLNEKVQFRRDVINAVLSEQAHDPARAMQGVCELSAWVKRENWEALLDAFARCARIIRGEDRQEFAPTLMREEPEKSLFESYQSSTATLDKAANIDGFLSAFACMVPAVTAFFDNVLVHADERALRNNRIALRQRIAELQTGRADLSQLENF
jgi:glycyl-tRNA synthetase beta subunit